MIKALRRKFVLTTISLLALVFAVLLTVLNVFVSHGEKEKLLEEMRSMAGAGRVPRFSLRTDDEQPDESAPFNEMPQAPSFPVTEFPEETPRPVSETDDETDNFSRRVRRWEDRMAVKEIYLVRFNSSGEVVGRNYTFDFGVSDESITALATEAASTNKETGSIASYLFLRVENGPGFSIVLRNYSDTLASARRLLVYSLLIGAAALAVLFAITVFLSKIVTKPAEQAFTRQKQFIADASHELKTPLSTISVNADVLKSEIGPDKWLENISSECSRMEELVISLLTLARMDADDNPIRNIETVNLSDAILRPALSFESIAFEKGISYSLDIEKDVSVFGNPSELSRLSSALIDNAFKYVEDRGSVSVSLKKSDRKVCFSVSNSGKEISDKDLPHIFERFYRADESRTDGCSFGLGLAICEEIAERHNGKITVESQNSMTTFSVTLPL